MKTTFNIFMALVFMSFSQIGLSQNKPHKNRTVQKIFQELKSVKGILPHEPPVLILDRVFTDTELTMAYIEYDLDEIHLEEKIYDICVRKLGADSLNGLAFILGHELAHYIHRHENVAHHTPPKTSKFLGDRALMKILKGRIENMDTLLERNITTAIGKYNESQGEAKADLEGGFISYLAGYHSDRVDPTLPSLFLSEVYDSIRMDTISKGYPRLEERQAIASASKVVLDSMIYVYDMANKLIAIEHYDKAINYLEFIIKKFDSREMYNNMGVAALLSATNCFDKSELPEILPITLDLDTRMDGSGKGRADYTEEVRLEKLLRAIGYLEKSAQMDEDYPIALLNLSIARLLLGKSHELSTELFSDSLKKAEAVLEQYKLSEAAIIKAKIAASKNLSMQADNLEASSKIEGLLSNICLQYASVYKERNDSPNLEVYLSKAKKWNAENLFIQNGGVQEFQASVRSEKCESVPLVHQNKSIIDAFIDNNESEHWSPSVIISTRKRGSNKEKQEFQSLRNSDLGYTVYRHRTLIKTLLLNDLHMYIPESLERSACGMKKGDTLATLISTYGKSHKYFSVSNGSYHMYSGKVDGTTSVFKGVVFHLNKENRVISWFSFLEDREPK